MATPWTKGRMIRDDGADRLEWHDVAVHGLGFFPDQQQIRLDIDYITDWPKERGGEFHVMPATLTFHGVIDCDTKIRTLSGEIWLKEVARGERVGAGECWTWRVAAREGTIVIVARGLQLFAREAPQVTSPSDQRLSTAQRGGICFDT